MEQLTLLTYLLKKIKSVIWLAMNKYIFPSNFLWLKQYKARRATKRIYHREGRKI